MGVPGADLLFFGVPIMHFKAAAYFGGQLLRTGGAKYNNLLPENESGIARNTERGECAGA